MDLLARGESAYYRCYSGRWIGDFEPLRMGAPSGRSICVSRSRRWGTPRVGGECREGLSDLIGLPVGLRLLHAAGGLGNR